ncbi:MAG: hypothetical protein ACRDYE_05055, partial [Acidimicrobiales bacterium]
IDKTPPGLLPAYPPYRQSNYQPPSWARWLLLALTVSRRAEGARRASPQEVCQLFTVDGGEIVEIRAYPDRAAAPARSLFTG